MARKKTPKNNEHRTLWILMLGAFALILIFAGILFLEMNDKTEDEEEIFEVLEKELEIDSLEEVLSTNEFLEIDIELSNDFIILKDKENPCEGMVVAISPHQTFSIQRGLESEVGVRPTSHDTIRDILEQYEIEVMMVKITELKGGAYFGRLILKDDEKMLNLDIRPSDGIAIAVRTSSPIYISKLLFEEYKEDIC